MVRIVGLVYPFSHRGRCFPGYHYGERAGFEPEIAQRLIQQGLATVIKTDETA
jgi:hypothetical protein